MFGAEQVGQGGAPVGMEATRRGLKQEAAAWRCGLGRTE